MAENDTPQSVRVDNAKAALADVREIVDDHVWAIKKGGIVSPETADVMGAQLHLQLISSLK